MTSLIYGLTSLTLGSNFLSHMFRGGAAYHRITGRICMNLSLMTLCYTTGVYNLGDKYIQNAFLTLFFGSIAALTAPRVLSSIVNGKERFEHLKGRIGETMYSLIFSASLLYVGRQMDLSLGDVLGFAVSSAWKIGNLIPSFLRIG